MLKRILSLLPGRAPRRAKAEVTPETSPIPTYTLNIVPRDKHNISRQDISEPAKKVLYRLESAGYEAYLVGG
ncbi:MAG: hypothetical protein LPK85_07135, partial [Gammaproteobacteria bacterium]|nr:hypothetical protein [Gammaproteobacteria bacterium]